LIWKEGGLEGKGKVKGR